jgi:hypothetical protein
MELSENYKSCLRHFVYYYTNGTLQFVVGKEDLLKGIDYREDLKDEASNVEMIFAIYSNNIKMDENGRVLNHIHSMTRAAQWIRMVCRKEGDDYEVKPEFEDWETTLY